MKKEGETRAFGETFGALLGDCEVLLDGTHSHAKSNIFRVGQSSERLAITFCTFAERRPLRRLLGEHSGSFFVILGGFGGPGRHRFLPKSSFCWRLCCESVFKVISGAVGLLGAGGSGALDGGGSLRNPG